MRQRKSFIAQLEKESRATPEPAGAASQPANDKPVPKARPDITKSSLYLPPAVNDRLREIAFTERCKMHDLFLEGIDRVIESRGHPERARPRTEA